jgi:uncharacterized Zn finger protein (UPF0148 family)
MYNKTCPICGAHFWTNSRGRVYCGIECKNKNRLKKKQESKPKMTFRRLIVYVKENNLRAILKKYLPTEK